MLDVPSSDGSHLWTIGEFVELCEYLDEMRFNENDSDESLKIEVAKYLESK